MRTRNSSSTDVNSTVPAFWVGETCSSVADIFSRLWISMLKAWKSSLCWSSLSRERLLHHEHSTAHVSDLMGYRAHQDAAALQQMIQTQILPAAQILWEIDDYGR
jgi:hypothetical protein